MAKRKVNESEADLEKKTFSDLTNRSWFQSDSETIKVGESPSMIMKGECETIFVKDIYCGDKSNTWCVAVAKDEKIYLLKSSRALK